MPSNVLLKSGVNKVYRPKKRTQLIWQEKMRSRKFHLHYWRKQHINWFFNTIRKEKKQRRKDMLRIHWERWGEKEVDIIH